jgi:hypothetical protein
MATPKRTSDGIPAVDNSKEIRLHISSGNKN